VFTTRYELIVYVIQVNFRLKNVSQEAYVSINFCVFLRIFLISQNYKMFATEEYQILWSTLRYSWKSLLPEEQVFGPTFATKK
jgi:hypothetical protein